MRMFSLLRDLPFLSKGPARTQKRGRPPLTSRSVFFNVLFIVLASMIPQAVFFGFIVGAYHDEVQSNAIADASKIDYTLKIVVFDPVTSVFPQHFSDIDANSTLTAPLIYDIGQDPYRVFQAISSLQDIKDRAPIFENLAVYYAKNHLFLQTDGWAVTTADDLPKDFDRDLLDRMTAQGPTAPWQVRWVQRSDGKVQVLDYVSRTPGSAHNALTVAVEIRRTTLEDLLSSAAETREDLPTRGRTAVLVNDELGPVAWGGNSPLNTEQIIGIARRAGRNPGTDRFWEETVGGRPYSVGAVASAVPGWSVLAIKPIENLDSRFFQLQAIVLLLSLGFLGLDILIAWIVHERFNRPLKDLIDTLQLIGVKNNIGPWDGDDDNHPEHFASRLAHRIDELRETVDKNRDSVRHHTVIGLLRGNEVVRDDNDGQGLLRDLGIEGKDVAALTVTLSSPTGIGAQDWVLAKIQLARFLNDAFAEALPFGVVIVDQARSLFGLVAFEPGQDGAALLEPLVAVPPSEGRLEFRLALGSQCPASVSSIRASYAESRMVAEHTFLIEASLLTPGLVDLPNRVPFVLRPAWTERFEGALANRNAKVARDMGRDLTAEVRGGLFTMVSVHEALGQVVYLLRRALLAEDPGVEDRLGYSLAGYLAELPDLAAFDSWFGDVVEQGLRPRDPGAAKETTLAEAIERDIRDNLYNDLSLTSVADRLRLNPSYLSRIFKNVMGIPYWDYVNEAKMREAETLLKTSSHSVKELSAILGYRSVQHFIKIFKERTGRTPGDFRETQRIDTNTKNS